MTIQLTPEQEELITLRMKTGEYQSIEDVLAEAFQLLRDCHDDGEAE
jgi:Arc/MetJ-type ribon-helix-helix transcriptional regulator